MTLWIVFMVVACLSGVLIGRALRPDREDSVKKDLQEALNLYRNLLQPLSPLGDSESIEESTVLQIEGAQEALDRLKGIRTATRTYVAAAEALLAVDRRAVGKNNAERMSHRQQLAMLRKELDQKFDELKQSLGEG